MTTSFPIHICSLEIARESDLTIYDGVITIENTFIENPFRVQLEYPKQLILRFDDISFPVDDFEEPREIHIYKSLQFANENKNGSAIWWSLFLKVCEFVPFKREGPEIQGKVDSK